MTAVWYRFRAELRSRWRATLALALLVGLGGAVVLTAVAGARRTDSAYPRYIAGSEAWDVLINPDLGDESALPTMYDRVAALPYVEELGEVVGVSTFPLDPVADQLEGPLQLVAGDARIFNDFARPNVLRGRMPDPRRAEEVLVDPSYAEAYDVGPGDRVPSVAVGFDELLEAAGGSFENVPDVLRSGDVGARVDLVVTGVGITPDRLIEDEGFAFPSMFLTPAFLEAYPDARAGFGGSLVRLEQGAADEPTLRTDVETLVPGETIEFQSRARVDETVDRAVQPYTVALWAFALAVGVTAVLVIGQAFGRQRVLDAVDDAPLSALGYSRWQLLALVGLRAVPAAVVGATIAIGIAVAASPLMPIGPARDAEPDRGMSLDALVLGVGAVVLLALVLVLALLSAHRLLRSSQPAATVRAPTLSRLLARTRLSPSATTGIRFACEPGRGRTAVPARTTMAAAVLAVGMVVAAFTFAASLDRLLETPRLFGVTWQFEVQLGAETPDEVAEQSAQLEEVLGDEPDVVAWSTLEASRVELDGRPVPAVAVGPRQGEVLPEVVAGRLPTADDEVALGARTLERLDASLGDRVTARFEGAETPLTVVGRVVLPGLGNYPGGDKTSPGDGALLGPGGLDRIAPPFTRGHYLAGTKPGSSVDDVTDRIGERLDPDLFLVTRVQRPADVVDLERVRATPLILAGMLGLLGLATIAHALVMTVRRRRRDLALLKTLGFSRGQVSRTVAWQASTVAVVAVTVGVPVGVALGRSIWTALARNIGLVPEPAVPWLAVVLSLPALAFVANIVAAPPAWVAGRTRPATVLRSE